MCVVCAGVVVDRGRRNQNMRRHSSFISFLGLPLSLSASSFFIKILIFKRAAALGAEKLHVVRALIFFTAAVSCARALAIIYVVTQFISTPVLLSCMGASKEADFAPQ